MNLFGLFVFINNKLNKNMEKFINLDSSDEEQHEIIHNSIVSDAYIVHIRKYLNKEESANLFNILNDPDKFKFQTINKYNSRTEKVYSYNNHRKSYWLGEYAQENGEELVVPDPNGSTYPATYAMPYEFPKELLEFKHRIEKEFDCEFNACLVGLFDDPKQKIGFHSDSGNALGDNPQIGSLSLGAPRRFKLRHIKSKNPNKNTPEIIELLLNNGDLLIMKDKSNVNYKHSVLKDPLCNKNNIRINLTFRNYKYSEAEKKIKASPWQSNIIYNPYYTSDDDSSSSDSSFDGDDKDYYNYLTTKLDQYKINGKINTN